jgi:glucose/arabinose dehydrogenase
LENNGGPASYVELLAAAADFQAGFAYASGRPSGNPRTGATRTIYRQAQLIGVVQMKLAKTAALAALATTGASARTNLGAQRPQATVPFVMTQVATFNLPWRLGFLPDGRMLMTEKVGPIWLVTQTGEKTPVANVPAVLAQGQGGMLGVFLSPHYAEDHFVYLTYSEPGDGGSSLALARAKLTLGQSSASLIDLKVIWRDGERGKGGQFGAQIAFSPESNHLFLTVGDRQRMTPAQDPNRSLGKILRLTSTGSPRPAIRWRAR